MNILKQLKYLKNNTIETKELNNIIDTLPSNEEVAKQILRDFNNNSTKIKFDKDIKNSYYVYFKDTIYISDTSKNNTYRRICLIAHECIHSIQSKILQKVNFILSNIEIISFIVCLIFLILTKSEIPLFCYCAICILSIIPRFILEIDAIIKSLPVSQKYLNKYLDRVKCMQIFSVYKKQIYLLLPIAIISLFFEKIVRILFMFFIKIII